MLPSICPIIRTNFLHLTVIGFISSYILKNSMAHIKLPEEIPGIRGLFNFSPKSAVPLLELAEVLLRGENSLSPKEREIIATYVSFLNECKFCMNSHAAIVRHLNDGDKELMEKVKEDYMSAPISNKLKALLTIAAKVQKEARKVLPSDILKAQESGATDKEIHDAVLIAAAFCMYNRYVDGLGAEGWETEELYYEKARNSVSQGYAPPVKPSR